MLMKVVRVSVAVIVLAAPTAKAEIVSTPAELSDHGTFITDSVSGLDWYKFANVDTTVYRSYNNVTAADSVFMTAGWHVADISEVQQLWSRFGWETDTIQSGITVNAGLTDALIGYLGATFSSYTPDGYDSRGIVARYAGFLNEERDTTWVYRETHANPDVVQHLDFVSSSWGPIGDDAANNYGTWLVRKHVPVPEPGTLGLLSLGLAGLGLARRRKLN